MYSTYLNELKIFFTYFFSTQTRNRNCQSETDMSTTNVTKKHIYKGIIKESLTIPCSGRVTRRKIKEKEDHSKSLSNTTF